MGIQIDRRFPPISRGLWQPFPKIREKNIPFDMDIYIDGSLTVWGEPEIFINILINNKPRRFRGIIDTGAYYSAVSRDIFSLIKPEIKKYETISVVQDLNRDLPIFDLRFSFLDHADIFSDEFSSYPNMLTNSIIIGTKFIERTSYLKYYGQDNKWEMKI